MKNMRPTQLLQILNEFDIFSAFTLLYTSRPEHDVKTYLNEKQKPENPFLKTSWVNPENV